MHSKHWISKMSLRKTSFLSSQLITPRQVDFAGLLTQLWLLLNTSTMTMTEKQIDVLHMALVFTADFPANVFSICKVKQYSSAVQLVVAGLNFAEQKSLVLSYKPEEAPFHLLSLLQHEDVEPGITLPTLAWLTQDRCCNLFLLG